MEIRVFNLIDKISERWPLRAIAHLPIHSEITWSFKIYFSSFSAFNQIDGNKNSSSRKVTYFWVSAQIKINNITLIILRIFYSWYNYESDPLDTCNRIYYLIYFPRREITCSGKEFSISREKKSCMTSNEIRIIYLKFLIQITSKLTHQPLYPYYSLVLWYSLI